MIILILLTIGLCSVLIFNYKRSTPIFKIIDGNIGSGKSTFLNFIKQLYTNYYFIDEPLDEWTSIINDDGKNLFELYYNNETRSRWCYTFQNYVLITKMIKYMDTIEEIKQKNFWKKILFGISPVIMTERSFLTDRFVFVQTLYETNKINKIELDILDLWFDTFVKKIKKQHIYYVNTSPENCYHRIHTIRKRAGEESISQEYLKNLDTKHNELLLNNDNVTIITND